MRRLACLLLVLCAVPSVFAQHLYGGNDQTAGGIRQYTLPVNGSSAPNFTVPATSPISVETDPGGTLVSGDLGGNLTFFAPPISAASTPYVSFKSGGVGAYQVAFTASGDIFVAGLTQVNRFNDPFSNSSVPVLTITNTGFAAYGVAIDAAQNLYIVDAATFLGGAISGNDSIVVSVDAGSAFIYGATTDNTTQDPSIQLGRK